MLSTSISVAIEMAVTEDSPKLARSAGPFGTVLGDQFVAVFQSPLPGVVLQVALPANAGEAKRTRAKTKWGMQIVEIFFFLVFSVFMVVG